MRINPNGAVKITGDQTNTYGLYVYNNAVHYIGRNAGSGGVLSLIWNLIMHPQQNCSTRKK